VQTQLVQLIKKKLAEALHDVDSATLENARAAWKGIGPAPTCPYVGDVMKAIHSACWRGYVERAEVAREVIVSTIFPVKDVLTPKTADEVMVVVSKAFPEDQFLPVARNTKGVYERGSTPRNKFDERVFELELAAITAGAANMARQAVSRIRTALDEFLLQRAIARPPWWRRTGAALWTLLALPLVKWAFGILATVIAAALLVILGLK